VTALRAVYRLAVPPGRAEERAAALALEQTVELPDAAVHDRFVREHVLARVERLEPEGPDAVRAILAYPVSITALDPAQTLNVLFGNSSLQPDVQLVDIEVPSALRVALGGPRHGIEGLRQLLGAPARPLTCTALKPMGLSPAALGRLAGLFARAGIDVIKDDHGLADHTFGGFAERVRACQRAVNEAAEETGRASVYAPSLMGGPGTLAKQLAIAEAEGVGAVMVCPMLAGLPFLQELVAVRTERPVLAHPAFAGSGWIAPAALLGRLFRLYGADAVIYPHSGGRFAWTDAVCRSVAERLRGAWPPLLRSLPVPAGGVQVDRAPDLVAFYGADVMLLIGGSLYLAAEGDAASEAAAADRLLGRTRELVEAVRSAVPGC
jgi:ribulose-bisphosphate carboxylase large chain